MGAAYKDKLLILSATLTAIRSGIILTLLTDTLTATAEELFPSGVPANNQMKGRHWNSKNREIKRLIAKRGQLMLTLAKEKAGGAAITKLEAKVCRKQRQIRENLRQVLDGSRGQAGDSVREQGYEVVLQAHQGSPWPPSWPARLRGGSRSRDSI